MDFSRRCWEQEGIDLEGVRERVATEVGGEEEKYREGAVQEETPGRILRHVVLW